MISSTPVQDSQEAPAKNVFPFNRPAAELFNDVAQFCGRFIAYPNDHALTAHVLWVAHTHAVKAFESTPRIAFLSPEPGSGKTRALEITELLVPHPIMACDTSEAAIFRKIAAAEDGGEGLPTLLHDEIDTLFNGKGARHEGVRGIYNSGHRQGAKVWRCEKLEGKLSEPKGFPVYCAVAFAGLGFLPETLMQRSVVIRMRKRRDDEIVQPYRRRDHAAKGEELCYRLSRWAADSFSQLERARPPMPDSIADRAADVWEPLFACADLCGTSWSECARDAALELLRLAKAANPSLGIRLLQDIRTVFVEDRLQTEVLLQRLRDLQEAPWSRLKSGPIDASFLAKVLGRYEIKPRPIRFATLARGYEKADLQDAWARYLTPDA